MIYDTTLSSPLQHGAMPGAARTAAYTEAAAAAAKRRRKERFCTVRNWSFRPFAFNSLGGMDREMDAFFTKEYGLKRKWAAVVGIAEWQVVAEKRNFYADLSCEIWRQNWAIMEGAATGLNYPKGWRRGLEERQERGV